MSNGPLTAMTAAAPCDSAPADPLALAQALYARDRWSEAERLCRAILDHQADHPGALTLLGIMLAQSGRSAEAAGRLALAARRMPDNPAAQINHGNVLRDLGRAQEALACYEHAIDLEPDHVEAHYNLGLVLDDLRRYTEALEHYERALEIEPGHSEAWNNRGAVLHKLARHREALESCDRALALAPRQPDALANRGAALHKLERYEEALDSLDRALALRPERADTHFNRGVTLRKLDRYREAIESLDRAIELSPTHVMAHSQRGVTLGSLRRFDEALASHDRALTIDPRCAEAHFDRGVTLTGMKRLRDAVACFEQALELGRRDVATCRYHGSVLHELNDIPAAIASYAEALAVDPQTRFLRGEYRHAHMQLHDWQGFEPDVDAIVAAIGRDQAVTPPFVLLSLLDSPAAQRKAAEIFVREFSPKVSLPPPARYPRHGKIRLGYFSADFRVHPVTLLAAELFELHDRSQFELTAFALGPDSRDELRTRVEAAFDRFLPVDGLSDRQIVALAREHQIDIAIDLGGYTRDSRSGIFALRTAPIQASYLGYLGTLGAPFMDYLIADPVLIPPQSRAHYSEKIAYLPSYQVNDGKRPLPQKSFSRAELGLPASGFVFCCFNHGYKITPDTFDSWMRILAAVPDSLLWLLGDSETAEHNLRSEAARHGVDPQRLIFGQSLPYADYLARYRAADLFLDTLPYNAGTTASDALWTGLPVLTLPGQGMQARMAASLLTAVGLPELIASDRAGYEQTAISLATDPQRLAALKEKLTRNRADCALFDTAGFTRNLETLYETMYARQRADVPPDHIFAAPAAAAGDGRPAITQRTVASSRKPTNHKYKYVIYAPPYDENIGGTIVLHRLCHLINECGGEAYLHPFMPSFELHHYNVAEIGLYAKAILEATNLANYRINETFKTPVLRPREDFVPEQDCIVVYPEIIFGNPLRAKNVVRWLLHDPGHHTDKIYYGGGEIYYRYVDFRSGTFRFPGSEMADLILRIQHTPIDLYREQPDDQNRERTGVAYCIRKGDGRTAIHDVENSILIDGKSHAEIAAIFKSVKRFISYDPYTQYSVCAAIAGCESIVVPLEHMTKEQWKPNVEDRYGISYGFEDIEFALATRHLALQRQISLDRESQRITKEFMTDVEARIDRRQALSAAG